MRKIFGRFAIVAVISLLGLSAIECAQAEHIEASPREISLAVKATQQLTISLVPVSGKATNVTSQSTYTSSDESVATVGKDGIVTGVKPGSTSIAVSYTQTLGGRAGTVTRTATVPVQVK